jgi:hypothetical protein
MSFQGFIVDTGHRLGSTKAMKKNAIPAWDVTMPFKSGGRNIPVVSSDGTYYNSTTEAAKHLRVSHPAIFYALREGTRCQGMKWRRATLDEIHSQEEQS